MAIGELSCDGSRSDVAAGDGPDAVGGGRPLLSERTCQVEPGEGALLDENLADSSARRGLCGNCRVELLLADEPVLDEDLAKWPPEPNLRRRQGLTGVGGGRNLPLPTPPRSSPSPPVRYPPTAPRAHRRSRRARRRTRSQRSPRSACRSPACKRNACSSCSLVMMFLSTRSVAHQTSRARSRCFHATPIGNYSIEV